MVNIFEGLGKTLNKKIQLVILGVVRSEVMCYSNMMYMKIKRSDRKEG